MPCSAWRGASFDGQTATADVLFVASREGRVIHGGAKADLRAAQRTRIASVAYGTAMTPPRKRRSGPAKCGRGYGGPIGRRDGRDARARTCRGFDGEALQRRFAQAQEGAKALRAGRRKPSCCAFTRTTSRRSMATPPRSRPPRSIRWRAPSTARGRRSRASTGRGHVPVYRARRATRYRHRRHGLSAWRSARNRLLTGLQHKKAADSPAAFCVPQARFPHIAPETDERVTPRRARCPVAQPVEHRARFLRRPPSRAPSRPPRSGPSRRAWAPRAGSPRRLQENIDDHEMQDARDHRKLRLANLDLIGLERHCRALGKAAYCST